MYSWTQRDTEMLGKAQYCPQSPEGLRGSHVCPGASKAVQHGLDGVTASTLWVRSATVSTMAFQGQLQNYLLIPPPFPWSNAASELDVPTRSNAP